jgi:L-alanine-DL-glutamate epimerase-like enolase superfamily enzyme
VGGIGEWLRVAALAGAYDVAVLPHYFPELHLPLVAATAAEPTIEIVPVATGADNFALLCASGAVDEVPILTPSARPGLGIEWDQAALERYAQP